MQVRIDRDYMTHLIITRQQGKFEISVCYWVRGHILTRVQQFIIWE